MSQELQKVARFNAAKDISHRWFAFMDGQTESLESHLDMFSDDVRLVHAGIHLLAYDKASMARWLKTLSGETGAHFIREFDVVRFDSDTAELAMRLSYQRLEPNGEVGGALTDYKAQVKFASDQTAVFTFLQKTPQFANPDRDFKDSFPENRVHSFVCHLFCLLMSSGADALRLLLNNAEAGGSIDRVIMEARLADLCRLQVSQVDIPTLSFILMMPMPTHAKHFFFKLVETGGRYLRIHSVQLLPELG